MERELTVHERMERVVGDLFGLGSVTLTDETTPADIIGWDSLANLNVMFALEKEFDIEFGEEDFSPIQKVGDLKDRLLRRGAT